LEPFNKPAVDGVSERWRGWAFLEGVSGILMLENSAAGGRSTLRFLFEMRPVDMKACGKGLAILKVAGVANASCDAVRPGPGGRIAPSGSDLENDGAGTGGFPMTVVDSWRGARNCVTGVSPSMTLDEDDDGVRVFESGCGFGVA
jgi:hypothetical protein